MERWIYTSQVVHYSTTNCAWPPNLYQAHCWGPKHEMNKTDKVSGLCAHVSWEKPIGNKHVRWWQKWRKWTAWDMVESDQGGCSGQGNQGGPPWGGGLTIESKIILLDAWQANKSRGVLGQRTVTLFRKPEDQGIGGLVSQRTILTKIEFRLLSY